MTCPVCKNQMVAHRIQVRKHLRYKYSFVKVGLAMVCPAEPVHTVDLLLYDVWP